MSCVYFILWLPEEQPCVTAAFVKCLPILSLIWFVCLQGVSSGVANSYNRKILTGLVFSCIGDALLIWQENILFFFAGMGNFGIAQIAYTIAFGFTPFGLKELIFSLSGAMVLLSIILPYLSGLLYYCISAYGLLLCLMGWRALARFNLKGEIPWRKIYAACGATLFVASDFAIAFNKFCLPIPGQRSVIMATYYAAQLCISLSVINSRLFFHSTQEECTTCKHSPPKSNSLNHNTAAVHWTIDAEVFPTPLSPQNHLFIAIFSCLLFRLEDIHCIPRWLLCCSHELLHQLQSKLYLVLIYGSCC